MIIEKIVKDLEKRICRGICMNKNVNIGSLTLANRIFNCLSDGYDDEEYKEITVTSLYNELSQIPSDSFVKAALVKMCERIEELEV